MVSRTFCFSQARSNFLPPCAPSQAILFRSFPGFESSLRHMQGKDFQGLLIPQESNYSGEKSDHHMNLKSFVSNVFLKYWIRLTDASNILNQFPLRKSKELFIRNKT